MPPPRSTAKVSTKMIDVEGEEETEVTEEDDKRITNKLHTFTERISDLPDTCMSIFLKYFSESRIRCGTDADVWRRSFDGRERGARKKLDKTKIESINRISDKLHLPQNE